MAGGERCLESVFGLGEESIRPRIKKAAEWIGLGRVNYTGHSLRVGHTQDLRARGVGELDIQDAGPWRSNRMAPPTREARRPSAAP